MWRTSYRRDARRDEEIFDDAGLEYLEVEFLADFFVAPASRRGPSRTALRKQLFGDGGHIRRAPHQGREHPRHAVRARPADRGVRRPVRRRRATHRGEGRVTSSCRSTSTFNTLDKALELATDAHAPTVGSRSTPGTWASSGSRPPTCAGSRPSSSRGSSSRTVSRRRWRTRSTRRSTTASCRARASSTCLVTSRRAGDGVPRAMGVEVLSPSAEPVDRGRVQAGLRDDARTVRRGRCVRRAR